ncbi:MAG: rubrerythrin family protein [Acidobacteriota bacterium]
MDAEKTEKTRRNLQAAYVGEAKAQVRNRLFSEVADKEGLVQVARLFRAVAEAESVHARNALALLGELKSTEENLRFAFEHENLAKNQLYPRFIREAEEEGAAEASRRFSQARDVEDRHSQLYRSALSYLVNEEAVAYFVCQVCGYVAESNIPERCPICGAVSKFFKEVE